MRISKQPEERRQELVEAAWDLFVKKGYEQTSVSDIVKKIGVAQGLFYYYFTSKKDIFLAVIDRFIESNLSELALQLRDESIPPLERFGKMIPGLSAFLTEAETMYPQIGEGDGTELFTIVQNHVLREMEPLVEKIITEGVALGTMETPYPNRVARFFIAGFMGVMGMPNRPGAEEMLQLILYAVERLLNVPRESFDPERK